MADEHSRTDRGSTLFLTADLCLAMSWDVASLISERALQVRGGEPPNSRVVGETFLPGQQPQGRW